MPGSAWEGTRSVCACCGEVNRSGGEGVEGTRAASEVEEWKREGWFELVEDSAVDDFF